MILYVPASAAEELSRALCDLSRPPAERHPLDSTSLFAWMDDSHGRRWIEIDTEVDIPVSLAADFTPIGTILQPWIEAGFLPGDTNAVLSGIIDSARGKRLNVWGAFPDFFKQQAVPFEALPVAPLEN